MEKNPTMIFVAEKDNKQVLEKVVSVFEKQTDGKCCDSYKKFTGSFAHLCKSIDKQTETGYVELVFVCGDSSVADAHKWSDFAEKYAQRNRPFLVVINTGLDISEELSIAIDLKVRQFKKFTSDFVSVICQPGYLFNSESLDSPMGLMAATIAKAAVSQSIGATRWFAVPNFAFPEGWNNSHSRSLDESRFVTLRTYAGLNGIFWSNGRTLAGDISDYRFIEIVRTVHKAVRLARRAVLPCIHALGDEKGVKEILARIRTALTGMTDTSPVELLGFELDAPEGQDIVNKGLMVEISLYGVPIIRRIIKMLSFGKDNA